MSETDKARRSPRDRRPNEVPHHPKLLTIAWILAAAAFAIMALWFWAILTGQGIVVTAEQNTAAANAELAAEAEAQAAAEESSTAVVEPEPAETKAGDEASPEPKADEADTSEDADTGVPTQSDTVTDEWDLGAWSVLSYGGNLVVSGNLANVSGEDQSGEVRVRVYSEGQLIATTQLDVRDFPAGSSERVQLESQSPWTPGSKILVLDYSPA